MDGDAEATLLVDASNAFNSINRMSALLSIRYICPSIATILINCYKVPIHLINDGTVVYLSEGTTQGDLWGYPSTLCNCAISQKINQFSVANMVYQ